MECRAAGSENSWGRDRRVPWGGPGSSARDPTANGRASTPERCVEAYYLQRTRFESIAERKLRRRELTEDSNVEIKGRARAPPPPPYISDKIWLARQGPKNRSTAQCSPKTSSSG
jgi:hypothetical protein